MNHYLRFFIKPSKSQLYGNDTNVKVAIFEIFKTNKAYPENQKEINSLLGDLRYKNFQESVVAKAFLVKLSEAMTVTTEQLVVMFSPLNLL